MASDANHARLPKVQLRPVDRRNLGAGEGVGVGGGERGTCRSRVGKFRVLGEGCEGVLNWGRGELGQGRGRCGVWSWGGLS